jgi:hypothetical protein
MSCLSSFFLNCDLTQSRLRGYASLRELS